MAVVHSGILDAQVGQQRLIRVTVFVELDRHFVDDLERSPLANFAFDFFSLVRAHIVFGQHTLDRFHARTNRLRIVRSAIHAQQILQHIHRDVGTLFDQLGQILADDLACKAFVQ